MANITLADPVTNDKRPETPSVMPPIFGSTDALLGVDVAARNKKLQDERRRNARKNRIGVDEQDNFEANLQQLRQPDAIDSGAAFQKDFLASVYGADAQSRDSGAPTASTAHEFVAATTEIATAKLGEFRTITVETIKKSGGKLFDIFIAEVKDIGNQAKTGDIIVHGHQEAATQDAHAAPAAEAHKEPAFYQPDSLASLLKEFAVEGEVQAGLPELIKIGGNESHEAQAAHHSAEGNPEELAEVRGYLAEQAKHGKELTAEIAQHEHRQVGERVQKVQEETGISLGDYKQAAGLSGDYGDERVANEYHFNAWYKTVVEMKQKKGMGDDLSTGGGSLRANNAAAGQEIRTAMTQGDEKGVKSQRVG